MVKTGDLLFALFLMYFPILPDPYHEGKGNVSVLIWVLRELDEVIHGERST